MDLQTARTDVTGDAVARSSNIAHSKPAHFVAISPADAFGFDSSLPLRDMIAFAEN
jgi:hypothetical protein